ncbi:GNAT family N-acetyltransferase [Aureimonas sp. AU40]|uniref:GNAT family N-acetyltransferase n=1 Tax=Aureimonas sp. AU40 TaxID=1637747 RepID=UPI000780EEB4|nr:GNAT family N-acetyltransferase [Aureimonas sp. AU40]
MSADFTLHASVEEIGREAWESCFGREPENFDFYRACEAAGPPGFTWFYAVLRDAAGVVAIVPGFGTRYRVDTTLQGGLRRFTDRLHRLVPFLMELNLFALGSPVAEVCHVGFSQRVPVGGREALLGQLVDAARGEAARRGYGLFAVKDAAERDEALWAPIVERSGFALLPGLPTASLDLPFRSVDDYLATLGRNMRRDLRRKRKAFAGVRVERRRNIDDLGDEVYALYCQTVDNSELQFEHLPRDYFPAMLRHLAPQAAMVLYFHEERLFGFNFVIETPERLIDKYIGMDYAVARTLNFYFNSWMVNVAWCIENGVPVYQSGQAFYGPKLRLGCRLSPNGQYFRHRNKLVNAILLQVARVVRLDRFDPAIADLVEADREEADHQDAHHHGATFAGKGA